jgi:hypothetical protein
MVMSMAATGFFRFALFQQGVLSFFGHVRWLNWLLSAVLP